MLTSIGVNRRRHLGPLVQPLHRHGHDVGTLHSMGIMPFNGV